MSKPVVIIGAGPAGLSAAIELKQLGIEHVMVVEREAEPGGIPRHSHHQGFGVRDLHRTLSGPRYAERLTKDALSAGVTLHLNATADLDDQEPVVRITSPSGIEMTDAAAVLIATGARERPRSARLVAGDRPAGVFTTGQLQQWVAAHRPIGSRALVVGAEHVSYSAVLTLRHAGVKVVALTTDLPRPQSLTGVATFVHRVLRVPTWVNTRVTGVSGHGRVTSVMLEDTQTSQQRQIDVDTIVFSADWIPDHELARRSGVVIDPASLGPASDYFGRTNRPGIYAAGNVLHPVETADRCALNARRIASAMASDLGFGRGPGLTLEVEVEDPIAWVWPNRIMASRPSETLLRLSRFSDARVVTALQGGQRIGEAKLRHGTPGQHLKVDASLLRDVDPDRGAVRFTLDS